MPEPMQTAEEKLERHLWHIDQKPGQSPRTKVRRRLKVLKTYTRSVRLDERQRTLTLVADDIHKLIAKGETDADG